LLAAVGMEPGTIARMVVLEAIIVGAVGTVVGAVLSVGMDLAFLAITPLLLGWENPMRFALWAVPVYGVITVVVVAIGASLPAWRASRVHVVEALAYE
jgi:putative ABC transport system permease protein